MNASVRFSRWLLLVSLLAAPLRSAEAHARLVRSVPAAGSRVEAPSTLSLTFSEALTISLSRVTLLDASNKPVPLGAVAADPGEAKTLRVPIANALPPGHYVVKWQVAGGDGHPVRGEFGFDIIAAAASGSAPPVRPPPLLAGASFALPGGMLMRKLAAQMVEEPGFSVESPAYVAIRAAQSTALVVLLGVLALQFVIAPRAARGTKASFGVAGLGTQLHAIRWVMAALGILLLATIARLYAQHMAFFGAGEAPSVATLRALLSQSTWALGWWLALGATLVGFWGLRRVRRGMADGWRMLAASALGVTVSFAMSGHAAAASAFAMSIHALHVLGAGGWVGSLAAVVLIAIPASLRTTDADRHVRVAELVRAFSPVALVCAGLIAGTGVVAAWRNLGSLSALWQARYGQVLLVKLVLLSVAAATGFFNWRYVLPALGTETATARLRRSATVELAAALLVLIVTAVLVATPMPMEMRDAMPG